MNTKSSKLSIAWYIVRQILLFIIVVCLVKLAFFPSHDPLPKAQPGGDYQTPVSQATIGSIENTIKLDASVMPDPVVSVKSPISGEVKKIYVADGQLVNKGQTLAQVVSADGLQENASAAQMSTAQMSTVQTSATLHSPRKAPTEPTKNALTPPVTRIKTGASDTDPRNVPPGRDPRADAGIDEDPGNISSENTQIENNNPSTSTDRPNEPQRQHATPARVTMRYIVATSSGKVKMKLMVGQGVSIGDDLALISPSTLNVQAQLPVEHLYRIGEIPKTAQVSIKNGPPPFSCTDLHLADSDSSEPNSNGVPATPTAQLRCQIPPQIKAFAGLSAKLELSSGSAKDAILVPVSAVEGRFEQGFVYVVPKDSEEEILSSPNPKDLARRVEVKLGITDGSFIQILQGVNEGTTLLTFAPTVWEEEEKKNSDENDPGYGYENYTE